ncbi:MAG: efflux RND transporter periplasmic adaptor subunit [Desulfuromonadaceae bacterium]|nr:efflux RND transporter periplasmic adaptor subunit [Desulfuromonadaceae bacterium]
MFHSYPVSRLFQCLVTVSLFLPVPFLVGCGNEQKPAAAPPPPMVTVTAPTAQTVTAYAEFTGVTAPFEAVEIRARVVGYLENVHFQDGILVKKGDLLFTIDPKPFRAKLEQAKADLLVREAEMNLAATTLRRKEGALKDKAISEVEVIQARAEQKKAAAAAEAARAQVETARLDLSYTLVRAPINGRIGRNLVDIGNLVGSDGPTLLTTIVNDNPIYIYFTVSERDILDYLRSIRERNEPLDKWRNPKLFLGLANEEGYPHEGKVDFAENTLDPATGTLKVRGLFDNREGILLPGLFAKVRLPVGNPYPALLVPDQAIGKDQRGSFILIVNKKNIVEYRPVVAGQLFGADRVIRSGVAEDDRVIVSGLQKAMPGMPVTAVPAGQVGSPETGPATRENGGGPS